MKLNLMIVILCLCLNLGHSISLHPMKSHMDDDDSCSSWCQSQDCKDEGELYEWPSNWCTDDCPGWCLSS